MRNINVLPNCSVKYSDNCQSIVCIFRNTFQRMELTLSLKVDFESFFPLLYQSNGLIDLSFNPLSHWTQYIYTSNHRVMASIGVFVDTFFIIFDILGIEFITYSNICIFGFCAINKPLSQGRAREFSLPLWSTFHHEIFSENAIKLHRILSDDTLTVRCRWID